MEINNKDSYFNVIYQAVIVNADKSQDPAGLNRLQVYIPQIHYAHREDYNSYMNESNKPSHALFDSFPWAISTISDLQQGMIVFVGCINNENGNYIIIGQDVNNTTNTLLDGTQVSGISLLPEEILNLAMPIIIQNEVGTAISDWPDNIPESNYTKINAYDKACDCPIKSICFHKGGWSIGLIQWHHARAYDTLFYIAQNDSNWRNCFEDKSLGIYTDLEASLRAGNTSSQRNNWGDGFHPTASSKAGKAIKAMLGSEIGKRCQRELAMRDTQSALNRLQSNPYNIQNNAILIFLLDIMNQFEPQSIPKAAEICRNGKDMMSQFNEFTDYWAQASNGEFASRRKNTIAYINELYKAGKLNSGNLVDIQGVGNVDLGNGQYCYPFIGSFQISSLFGWRGAIAGTSYSGANFHSGVDFLCPGGTTLVACTTGTVAAAGDSDSGYGIYVKITADDGNTIIYGHMQSVSVSKGQRVVKGTVLGYSDDTGNSSGNHLHFEIRLKEGTQYNYNSTDPLPFIGCQGYSVRKEYVGNR